MDLDPNITFVETQRPALVPIPGYEDYELSGESENHQDVTRRIGLNTTMLGGWFLVCTFTRIVGINSIFIMFEYQISSQQEIDSLTHELEQLAEACENDHIERIDQVLFP